MPGGGGQHGLHRLIQLAAKATTANRRHDTHLFRRQIHDQGNLVTVHIWRLGRDMDFQTVAVAPGEAGFGLNIGMFDETGAPFSFCRIAALTQSFGAKALAQVGIDQQVAWAIIVQLPGALGQRLFQPGHRHQGFIDNRQFFVGNRRQRFPLPHQGKDRLAPVAHLTVRENRLIL